MHKVYSGCLLFTTLVFTSAHAPTFQVWRSLATASADTHSEPAASYLDSHASFVAMDAFTATDEYAEESDLNRFEVDEFNLPKLDVDLPELFNWSDGKRNYLASNTRPISLGQGLDQAMSIALHGGVSFGYSRGSALSSGQGAGASRITQTQNANLSSKGASATPSIESAPSSNSDSSSNEGVANEDLAQDTAPEQLANNEPNDQASTPGNDIFAPIDPALLPPTTDTPPGYTIVDEQKPVQVPAPGAFGLFVLGLAGLRLVGRKKNGSG